MRFDCPRCGDNIKTDLEVGEIVSCLSCRTQLKILGDNLAAVFSGTAPTPVPVQENSSTSELETAEFQAAVLTATQDIPDRKSSRYYKCPRCGYRISTECDKGGRIRCSACNASLKIISPDKIELNSDVEPDADKGSNKQPGRHLTLKSKPVAGKPKSPTANSGNSFPTILRFVCPQCEAEVRTPRPPGQTFMCHRCGAELKILSHDAVTLILGNDQPYEANDNNSSARSLGSLFRLPFNSYRFSRYRRFRPLKTLLRIIFSLTVVAFSALLSFNVYSDLSRGEIIVHPINVPSGMHIEGFTAEVIAGRIADQMRFIATVPDFKIETASSGQRSRRMIPQISIAGTETRWSYLMTPVKDLIGKSPAEVTGEIVIADRVLCLTIRVLQEGKIAEPLRRDIYGTLAEIDGIVEEAAGFVMEVTCPDAMSAYRDYKTLTEASYDFRVISHADTDATGN